MPFQIESQVLAEQPALVKRAKLPAEEIGHWLPEAYTELFCHLDKLGVSPAGPPFARYDINGQIAVEAGVPVAEQVAPAGELSMAALPAGPVATTLHIGRYEDITGPYEALQRWIILNGHERSGPYWEVYLTDPAETPEPDKQQTVLFMQYRPSSR